MKVLVTGHTGFIGKNLSLTLKARGDCEVVGFNSLNRREELTSKIKDCAFVYHLAATHRPIEEKEYKAVNCDLFNELLDALSLANPSCPVLLTSSIMVGQGTAYADSKKNAEKMLIDHAKKNKSRAIIYRLTNTFGPYGRPNGHSVVATFCHNIAHDLPIFISDRNRIIEFYYVGDVVEEFVAQLNSTRNSVYDGILSLDSKKKYKVTLGELADKIYEYSLPSFDYNSINENDEFSRKLYLTYISYKKK